jgi:hypothetical protein
VFQQGGILFLFFLLEYRPVGMLKNLLEKTNIKYYPVGILRNLIEKQK